MMPFKPGLGMLVAETNVPIVPCGLLGTVEALPPKRKVPRPVKIKLIIGEALNFAATPNNREGWLASRAGCGIDGEKSDYAIR